MLPTLGKKLQQARLSKQLSVEEAARATRIRPDKLIDLEDDNYSNFPSISYAKGFLQIYGRFLDVDVRELTDHLHTPNPVSSDDYEYLNAAASARPPPPDRRPYHFTPRRQHTILPVIVFSVLVGAVALAIYLFVNFQRIGPLDDVADKKDNASPAISTLSPVAAPESAAPSATPEIAASTPIPAPMHSPAPAAVAPSPATASSSASPAPTFDPSREVRRAEPVAPSPPAHTEAAAGLPPVASGPATTTIVPASSPEASAAASPAASPASSIISQVTIRPLKKTRVTIRKDVADSAPVFEDWLYPGDGPLKLRGRKFWIQVAEPGSVEIMRDGQPVPSTQGDIQIE